MSTHSFIGIESESGKIAGVYCHYDGYLEGVGDTLKNHYTNPDKIHELIGLGSLSILGEEIGEKQDFSDSEKSRAGQWTLAYHRDRGEELVIEEFDSMYSIDNKGGYEYLYVYTNMGFWMYKTNNASSPWLPLV